MFNFDLLNKAINKLDEQKKQQAKPKVDAAKFIDEVSSAHNAVDKYFIGSPSTLLDTGDKVFRDCDLESLNWPITLQEMMERL